MSGGSTDTARPARPGRLRGPASATDRARWAEADRAARPARLARLRARMAAAGVDAYLGVRPEHSRYLTGLVLGDGEEKVAGVSGWFVVGPSEAGRVRRQPLHDPGRSGGARGPDRAGLRRPGDALAGDRWPASARRGRPPGRRRGRLHQPRRLDRACRVARPGSSWSAAVDRRRRRPAGAAGSRPTGRSRSRPSSNGSLRPAPSPTGPWPRSCPRSGPGVTERGARLAARGPDPDRRRRRPRLRRRLPGRARGGPAPRLAGRPAGPVGRRPPVRLRGPGRGLSQRHDPDPVRGRADRRATSRSTIWSCAPSRPRSTASRRPSAAGGPLPTGPEADALARDVIVAAGHGDHFGHGTGHGIGLATHELPSLGKRAAPTSPAQPDRLLGRARGLPRRADGRPDRGPRGGRPRGRPGSSC